MAKSVREVPPPLELLCLNVLWDHGAATVRQVREVVAEKRPLAYTTIMTVLDRLVRKGFVSRRKRDRSFAYTAAVTRQTMQEVALREFVEGIFAGSEDDLIRYIFSRRAAAVAATEAATASPEFLSGAAG
jgi:BlaI family transcriptional regulator, penicillinase repressor